MYNPRQFSRKRKATRREAILWLIYKFPQTEEEIAEHFGLSIDIVNKTILSLLKKGLVVRFRKDRKILLKDNNRLKDHVKVSGNIEADRQYSPLAQNMSLSR